MGDKKLSILVSYDWYFLPDKVTSYSRNINTTQTGIYSQDFSMRVSSVCFVKSESEGF
jgi:hypothetical protein